MDQRVAIALVLMCEEKQLGIADLVKDTGFPRNTVSRHYNGKTVPKRDDREEYAKSVGMEFAAFEEFWQKNASRNSLILAWFSRLPDQDVILSGERLTTEQARKVTDRIFEILVKQRGDVLKMAAQPDPKGTPGDKK